MRTGYEDIMHLPHHVSATRPRMSMHDRAAQFAPFAALAGYDAAIRETARTTETRPELDEYEREDIGERLCRILRGGTAREACVTYFRPDERRAGGALVTVRGAVRKIDAENAAVVMADGRRIPIGEITALDGAAFAE